MKLYKILLALGPSLVAAKTMAQPAGLAPAGTSPPPVAVGTAANITEQALTLPTVLALVTQRYPLLKAAFADQAAAEAELLNAEGQFDVTWKTRAAAVPLGYYQQVRADTVIEKPTDIWGSSFFAGYKLGLGDFASLTAASLRQDGDLAATDGHAVAHAGSFAYLRRKRGEVSRQFVAEHRAAMLAAYGTDVGALDLLDVDPPEALADALNAVVRAEAEADENFFRASSECKQTVLAADHSLQLATTRAQAVQKEIETLGQYLEGLRANQQLTSYVQRRQHEVLKGARTTYVRTKESV